METKAFFKHTPERARQRLQHGSVLRNAELSPFAKDGCAPRIARKEGRPSSGAGRKGGPSNDDGQECSPRTSAGRASGSRSGRSSLGSGGSSSSNYSDDHRGSFDDQ